MVTGLQARAANSSPQVRPMDPRRDGRAVAALLEMCFHAEGIDDGGQRLLSMLRHYGPFEAWTLDGAPGYVWHEDNQIVGNASIQRNSTRRDTWIVGNVATHPNYRGRGIATRLVEACVRHAYNQSANHVALQVYENNAPARHIYTKLGFAEVGSTVHYRHAPLNHLTPLMPLISPRDYLGDSRAFSVRGTHWGDRDAIWQLVQQNVPAEMTYAESFDRNLYQLGLRWSFVNTLNGNPEQWRMGEGDHGARGAIRTRANIDQSEHHLELLLDPTAAVPMGAALAQAGLERLRHYISRPILAIQCRVNPNVHGALQLAGFQPVRELVHMRMPLR